MFQHTPRVLFHMVTHDSPHKLRRPPQSNYPPGTVPHPDHGCGLGTQHMQSGISSVPPPEPESGLHSLPPILRNTCQVPIPRCSKGPRGLSVLPRVTSIFTRSAISPSPQLRQCPSRYAIRAGRNFVSVPCYQGDRLCLHLGSSSERPRLALRMDLPDRLDVEPHREGISRYGATIPEERKAAHRIFRRLLPS